LLGSRALENAVFLQDEVALPVGSFVDSDTYVLEFIRAHFKDELIFPNFKSFKRQHVINAAISFGQFDSGEQVLDDHSVPHHLERCLPSV